MRFYNLLIFVSSSLLLGLTACSQNNRSQPQETTTTAPAESHTTQDRAVLGSQLSYAVSSGNLTLAKTLIFGGEDVNAPNPVGETPLIIAIKKGDSSMLRLLLKHGAQPNYLATGTDSCNRLLDLASAGDTRFYTLPLDIARKKGKQNIVRLLEQHGAKSAADCFKKVNTEQRVWEEQSNKHYYE